MALPNESSLTTFDIVPWNCLKNSYLRVEDFQEGRFKQIVADLSDINVYMNNLDTLNNAEIIFIDASKDGVFEQILLDNFNKFGIRKGTIVILDDIRVINMIKIWRVVDKPKLDITSIGHWSGTGIIHWSASL